MDSTQIKIYTVEKGENFKACIVPAKLQTFFNCHKGCKIEQFVNKENDRSMKY